jgi:hypothetical protein
VTQTGYCYVTCPWTDGCKCFDGDGNERLQPSLRVLTDRVLQLDAREDRTLEGERELVAAAPVLARHLAEAMRVIGDLVDAHEYGATPPLSDARVLLDGWGA